jgi:beta-glucanase (GH16 family)
MSNSFSFNSVILKKVFDYDSVIKINLEDRRAVSQPDGSFRSAFVCSRQVTVTDADLVKFIRENLTSNDEFLVNVNGYLTTTFSNKKEKWYENMVATEITLA